MMEIVHYAAESHDSNGATPHRISRRLLAKQRAGNNILYASKSANNSPAFISRRLTKEDKSNEVSDHPEQLQQRRRSYDLSSSSVNSFPSSLQQTLNKYTASNFLNWHLEHESGEINTEELAKTYYVLPNNSNDKSEDCNSPDTLMSLINAVDEEANNSAPNSGSSNNSRNSLSLLAGQALKKRSRQKNKDLPIESKGIEKNDEPAAVLASVATIVPSPALNPLPAFNRPSKSQNHTRIGTAQRSPSPLLIAANNAALVSDNNPPLVKKVKRDLKFDSDSDSNLSELSAAEYKNPNFAAPISDYHVNNPVIAAIPAQHPVLALVASSNNNNSSSARSSRSNSISDLGFDRLKLYSPANSPAQRGRRLHSPNKTSSTRATLAITAATANNPNNNNNAQIVPLTCLAALLPNNHNTNNNSHNAYIAQPVSSSAAAAANKPLSYSAQSASILYPAASAGNSPQVYQAQLASPTNPFPLNAASSRMY
jgi:hypothetical protein